MSERGHASLVGLLDPGSAAGYAVAGDQAVLAALVRAELAWAQVLADGGWAPEGLPSALSRELERRAVAPEVVAAAAAEGGNPVIPLLAELRGRIGDPVLGRYLHRGLTSQDVLDTALMLVVRDALDHLSGSLTSLGDVLAALAQQHRETVMVGRTLTQHAVPITLGLKIAQWLIGVQEALSEVRRCRSGLPVQCGGAAGTLAGVLVAAPVPAEGHRSQDHLSAPGGSAPGAWAAALGLVDPGYPWHTRRRPVTRVGDTVAAALGALGHLATDVALLSRPEIGELSTLSAHGRGVSSTMPHKRNPVAAVLLRSAALQAGPAAGALHQCAALAIDERSDGAWHAEWPLLQRLLVLGVGAGEQAVDLARGLTVDPAALAAHVAAAGEDLMSEWRGLTPAEGGEGQPRAVPGDTGAADYTGHSALLVDRAVDTWQDRARS